MRLFRYLFAAVIFVAAGAVNTGTAHAAEPSDCMQRYEELNTRINNSYAEISVDCPSTSYSLCEPAPVPATPADPVCQARHDALSARNAGEYNSYAASCPDYLATISADNRSNSSGVAFVSNTEKLQKQIKKLKKQNQSFKARNKRLNEIIKALRTKSAPKK